MQMEMSICQSIKVGRMVDRAQVHSKSVESPFFTCREDIVITNWLLWDLSRKCPSTFMRWAWESLVQVFLKQFSDPGLEKDSYLQTVHCWHLIVVTVLSLLMSISLKNLTCNVTRILIGKWMKWKKVQNLCFLFQSPMLFCCSIFAYL